MGIIHGLNRTATMLYLVAAPLKLYIFKYEQNNNRLLDRFCARIYFSFATIFANLIFFLRHFLELGAQFLAIFRPKKKDQVFDHFC